MISNFENTRQNTEEVKNMANVRKASELTSLDELNLPKRIYNCVKNIQPEELIFLVRTRKKIAGIGEKLSKKLETAVDQAGFIRHDFDTKSCGLGDLCGELGITLSFENEVVNIGKIYGFPKSNDDYENLKKFTNRQIKEAILLIDELLFLSPFEADMLMYHFHLNESRPPLNVLKIFRWFRIGSILQKLRDPDSLNRLKHIVCIPSGKEHQGGFYVDNLCVNIEREVTSECFGCLLGLCSRKPCMFTDEIDIPDFLDLEDFALEEPEDNSLEEDEDEEIFKKFVIRFC